MSWSVYFERARPGQGIAIGSQLIIPADRNFAWNPGMTSLGGVVSGTYNRQTVNATVNPVGVQSSFTASVDGSGNMTVTAVASGAIASGQTVIDASGNAQGVITSGAGAAWVLGAGAYYGALVSQNFTGLGDDTANIQNALNACPAGQVVALAAGTFIIGSAGGGSLILMPSNVTLRGAAPVSSVMQSILYKPNGGWRRTATAETGTNGILTPLATPASWDDFPIILAAPSVFPQADESTAQLLVSDAVKGTTSVTVQNGSTYTVGQYAVLDELSGATWQAVPNGFGCTDSVAPTPCPPFVWAGDRVVWNIHYPIQQFQDDAGTSDANAPSNATVSFTGSVSGNTLTSSGSPALVNGMRLFGTGLANPTSLIIGSANTWTVIPSQTVASTTITGYDYSASTFGFCRNDRPNCEIKKIIGITGNVVTFESPIGMTYRASNGAQLTTFTNAGGHTSTPFTTLAGVERLKMRGGGNGNLRFGCAAYCWARNVESTEWVNEGIAGNYAYRIEVRDSYSHVASEPTPCGGGYSISLANACSEWLIENNIILDANKMIVGRASGMGTVFGYNYADNGWISFDVPFVECGVNGSHLTGSHHWLFEGNVSFNADSDYTHGNSIYNTHFRNWYTGQRRDMTDSGQQRCFGAATWSFYHSFVGNVGGYSSAPSWISTFAVSATDAANSWTITDGAMECDITGANCIGNTAASATWGNNDIWLVGLDQERRSQVPDALGLSSIIRDGNYDYVSGAQHWYTTPATFPIPNSMYLAGQPGFFSTYSDTWPIVNPASGQTFVNPALHRYNNATPNSP